MSDLDGDYYLVITIYYISVQAGCVRAGGPVGD